MCAKRSQADGSDVSVSLQGPEGAQVSWCRRGPAAQPLGGWASALTPALLGEAGARRLGDACCSSSSAISTISLRADLLSALV